MFTESAIFLAGGTLTLPIENILTEKLLEEVEDDATLLAYSQ